MTRGRSVWIDGTRVALAPAALIGEGGEAEIYDLGDGRVLKWWKPPGHPDFAGAPEAQAAAAHRIAERPARLRALPGSLPPEVIAPCGFATAGRRAAEIVGYVMPRVAGEPLHSYGEPRWRRDHPVDGNDVVAALLALHAAIDRLHRLGVVIGDCNDLNVLVDGRRVALIDVDSYQLAGYPCPMFSERFVDPRLCDARLQPVRPHDAASDWFAFAVMVFRSLFGVSPWGGVTRRCSGAARTLQRITVYASDVIYPRAARPLATVPDELGHVFRAIFERDERGGFPRGALAQLRFVRCARCGDEHARIRCPACQPAVRPAPAPAPAIVHGRLRWQPIAAGEVGLGLGLGYEVTATTPVWLDGAALYRARAVAGWPSGSRTESAQSDSRERIGGVLAGLTRAWVGRRLGVGFYRAAGYAVGFVFRPEHGVLDDRVALPAIRGQLVAAHATIGDDRAWLWLTCAIDGRIATTCVVIGADAAVLATEQLADAAWLAGIAGACAAGPHLFVPTDDGVARIELVQGAIVQTRTFAETAPLVAAGDRLALHPTGLDAIRRHDAIRMHLT
ncbi:MAG TPA: hypothetical protein VH165_20465 [Kofleriaceae bacterium]|nr:hypothetical protein [Kofleriaceae bacterium]